MRSAAHVLLALLVLSAASGCMGPAKKAEPTPTETDPYALPPGVTNVLQGQVLAEDQTPLAGANVTIISLQENRTTNAQGEYRFESLEPRDYLISVTLEGFRTKTQRAIIEDGKIFELNFKLDLKPNLAPYSEVFSFKGQISCEVAYATTPEAAEYHSCGDQDPNNAATKEFSFPGNGAQVVVEAFWEPTQDAAKLLQMSVESVGFGHQDIVFGTVSGETGLKLPISQSLMLKYYPTGGTIRVTMHASPGMLNNPDSFDTGAAVQQQFDLYVTVFYVEVGSANYSVMKDGEA